MVRNTTLLCPAHHGHVEGDLGGVGQQPHDPEAVDGLQPAQGPALRRLDGLLEHPGRPIRGEQGGQAANQGSPEHVVGHGAGLGEVALQPALQTVGVARGAQLLGPVTRGRGGGGEAGGLLLHRVRGVHGQAARAGDQVAALQEPQTVLETLLAVPG